MSKLKEFDEAQVVASLRKKKDLRIEGKQIQEVMGREAKGDAFGFKLDPA